MASKDSSNQVKDDWKLSLYELQRTPHAVITDDTVIASSPEAIHKDLMCPICLDLLTKTMATKCLHRFCSVCIVTALRAGNKKCPTCRKRLISKRCLRPDPNIDSFIAKMYPDREEFNAQRNKIMESLNQSKSQDNMLKSMNEGLKEQKLKRSYNTKNKRSAEQTKSGSSNMLAPSTSSQVDNNVTELTVQTNGTKKKKITGLASTTVVSDIIECNDAFNSVSLNVMEPSTSSQVGNNGTESTVQTNVTKKKITGLTSTTVVSNIIECNDAFNSVSLNVMEPSTSSQVGNNGTESTVQTNGTKKMKITGLASTTVVSNIIESNGAFNGVSSNDMELVFKPHPKEMHSNNQPEKALNKTDIRYIKAPSVATVAHLSRYLTIRLNLDHGKKLGSGHQNVLIYISQTADQYELLDNNLTLQNVQEKFWNAKKEKPMEIFYSYN